MILNIKQKKGLKFINVGELSKSFLKKWYPRPTAERNWENSREFGFISAGQGIDFQSQLEKVKVDDILCAYLTGFGFVGIGVCTEETIGYDKSFLKDIKLPCKTNLSLNKGIPGLQEYVLKVNWFKSTLKDRNNGLKYGSGITSHIVCDLTTNKKKFVEEYFKIKFI